MIGEFDEYYPNEFIDYLTKTDPHGILPYYSKYMMEFISDNFEFDKMTYLHLAITDVDTGRVLINAKTRTFPSVFCCYLEATPEILYELIPYRVRGYLCGVPLLVSSIKEENSEKIIYEVHAKVPDNKIDDVFTDYENEYIWERISNIDPPEEEVNVVYRLWTWKCRGVEFED